MVRLSNEHHPLVQARILGQLQNNVALKHLLDKNKNNKDLIKLIQDEYNNGLKEREVLEAKYKEAEPEAKAKKIYQLVSGTATLFVTNKRKAYEESEKIYKQKAPKARKIRSYFAMQKALKDKKVYDFRPRTHGRPIVTVRELIVK